MPLTCRTMKRNAFLLISIVFCILYIAACNTEQPSSVMEDNRYARQLTQAQTAFDQQDYAQAIEKCSQALKYDPNNAAAYAIRGQANNVSGKLNDFKKAIEFEPNDVGAYVGLGWVYKYGLKQEQQATDAFIKAVAIRTENYQTYLWRGQAYVELKQYLRALESFTKSIELAPNDTAKAEAYLQRGFVYLTFFQQYEHAIDYLWIEDYHRAEKDCEKSAEVDQASWVPHLCSGLVHLGMPTEEKRRGFLISKDFFHPFLMCHPCSFSRFCG